MSEKSLKSQTEYPTTYRTTCQNVAILSCSVYIIHTSAAVVATIFLHLHVCMVKSMMLFLKDFFQEGQLGSTNSRV